jgi:hypothetical protein
MRAHHNKKCRDLEFVVGEWTWLRLQHRSAAGVTSQNPSKLAPCFYGPYKVLERIGEVAYRLHLPAKSKIHDVFHVSLLKKFTDTPPDHVVHLPVIQHGHVIPVPDQIVRARLNRGIWEVLVSWQGRSSSDTTWEKLDDFKIAYPEVQLRDELFRGEGGNVVDSFAGQVYRRRRQNKELAQIVSR